MTGTLRNVLICRVSGDAGIVTTIKGTLTAEGYSIKEGNGGSADLAWAQAIVVPITTFTKGAGWLKGLLMSAAGAGIRIVGVWTPGMELTDLPDELNAYASAIVCGRSDEIRAAVGGSNISQDPECRSRTIPDTKRVTC